MTSLLQLSLLLGGGFDEKAASYNLPQSPIYNFQISETLHGH